jgi:hypothetical protein
MSSSVSPGAHCRPNASARTVLALHVPPHWRGTSMSSLNPVHLTALGVDPAVVNRGAIGVLLPDFVAPMMAATACRRKIEGRSDPCRDHLTRTYPDARDFASRGSDRRPALCRDALRRGLPLLLVTVFGARAFVGCDARTAHRRCRGPAFAAPVSAISAYPRRGLQPLFRFVSRRCSLLRDAGGSVAGRPALAGVRDARFGR